MHGCFRTQLPEVQFPEFLELVSKGKIIDVAEVNQRCCLEESEKMLENVNPTHLGLASGKLVVVTGRQSFAKSALRHSTAAPLSGRDPNYWLPKKNSKSKNVVKGTFKDFWFLLMF